MEQEGNNFFCLIELLWTATFTSGPDAGRRQKLKICTQLLFTGGVKQQTNQDVSSKGCWPKHFPNVEYSHSGHTHQILTPTCFVDGPHTECQKDARRANVEPAEAQAS